MKRIMVGQEAFLGQWLADQTQGQYIEGVMRHIGLVDDETGRILAVTGFGNCNGASVMMHVAGVGKSWLNREFLWFSFHYPFAQLGVNTILSPVESWNTPCRRFIEHIGFLLEATLKDCSPGGDLLLYSMKRDDCRWLSLKDKYRGKTLTAENT